MPRTSLRKSTDLMRAVPVMGVRGVAVLAKNTKAIGIAMGLKPAVQPRPRAALAIGSAMCLRCSLKVPQRGWFVKRRAASAARPARRVRLPLQR